MNTKNDLASSPQSAETPRPASVAPQPARSRIFLVDDHAMFRDGLRQLIDREPDLVVCGDAATADEALRGIGETRPDLAIVDISLAGASGIDLIKTLRSDYPDMPVLVVSMHDESLYAERALRAGAMGYVMKQEPAKTVKTAIRKVLGGDMHLSEKLASSLVSRFMHGAPERSATPIQTLSDRELEVFRLIGQGKGTRQIAAELEVTVATINSFRNRIKEKLDLKTSTEVMLHAIQWVQGEGRR
ncbi:MAG TPA: response regulator transcription factor [Candidatus Acidoferrum sp.]|nr:response regulator transcription factor [Candidatus Acidoferrum sp.]